MTSARGLLVLAIVLGACGGAGSGANGGAAQASATPASATYPPSAATEPPKAYGYGGSGGGPATTAVTGELKIVDNMTLGKILAGSDGMTLYTSKADSANTSTCYNACAITWAPYTISGDPAAPQGLNGKLGTAARTDSSRQVTYNGLPLYTYSADQVAGNANGEGLEGNWFSIKNP